MTGAVPEAARRRRRWRKRLVLLAASTVVTVAAAEAALRLLDLAIPDPPLYPGDRVAAQNDHLDARIGWKLPPHAELHDRQAEFSVTYRSNGQGFRDPREFTVEPDARRIAFLGDSFTFGNGVEQHETFAHLVERRLERTRAYNFGMSGFGVDQMWMTLRHCALAVAPHVAVVSFVEDDLRRALSAYRWRDGFWPKPAFRLDGDRLVPMTERDRPGPLVRFLQRSSHLWQAARRVQDVLGRDHAVGHQWHLNRALFAAIRDDCRQAGVRLLVVFLPDRSWESVPTLARGLPELGIDFLDLARSQPASPEALFYRQDRHLNAAGHRFVAAAIAAALSEREW